MNLELTQNNFFKFGYDKKSFIFRESPNDKWWIKYEIIHPPKLQTWKESCLETAKEIRNRSLIAQKKIAVCYSGGIDSEVVAESFRLSGIEFELWTLRFSHYLNSHELQWVEKYAQKYQIPIKYIDINPIEFYQSEKFRSRTFQTRCFFPMLTLQMEIMEKASISGYFPVVGSAECYLENSSSRGWLFFEREIYASLYRFQILQNFSGVCGFFQWSPELIINFLRDPLVEILIKENPLEVQKSENSSNLNSEINLNKADFKFVHGIRATSEIKHEIYKQHFEIEKRPKYYGWEQFSNVEKDLRIQYSQIFQDSQGEVKIEYTSIKSAFLEGRSIEATALIK